MLLFLCCIQGHILFATNLEFEKHGPLALNTGGKAVGSAVQAINQRKRYDQELTMFDDEQDDRIEEHLAQKTASTPQKRRRV